MAGISGRPRLPVGRGGSRYSARSLRPRPMTQKPRFIAHRMSLARIYPASVSSRTAPRRRWRARSNTRAAVSLLCGQAHPALTPQETRPVALGGVSEVDASVRRLLRRSFDPRIVEKDVPDSWPEDGRQHRKQSPPDGQPRPSCGLDQPGGGSPRPRTAGSRDGTADMTWHRRGRADEQRDKGWSGAVADRASQRADHAHEQNSGGREIGMTGIHSGFFTPIADRISERQHHQLWI